MGASVFAGVAVMVLTFPLTANLSMRSRELQKKVMNIKDNRIKVSMPLGCDDFRVSKF
jgi:hypothetical protein